MLLTWIRKLFNREIEIPKLVGMFLDIETLGTKVTSQVLSIGVVVGDLSTGEVLDRIQINLSVAEQSNRTVDAATVHFWHEVRFANQKVWYLNTKNSITDLVSGLNQLDDFMLKWSGSSVWGNGPEFDQAIVKHLYEQYGKTIPWEFRDNQSVRTMVLLGRLIGIDPKYDTALSRNLLKHVAVDDAELEFIYCSIIYRKLLSR